MARQIIDTGTLALNGQDGDTNREAADKANANFAELYNADAASVRGPASAANGAIAVFSGTTGKVLSSVPASTFEPALPVGTAAQYRNGLKALVDFATSVRASVLTGLSVATGTAVVAADTILSAIGKLQAQITAVSNGLADSVRATALTGLSLTTNAAITATDTVLTAFGKLQGQITAAGAALADNVRAVTLAGIVFTTSTAVTAADTILSAIGKLQAQITARALKGANSDITSLSALSTPLSVSQGGTGGGTQSAAQIALGLVPVTSNTDATAGRLLLVNSFGVGGFLPRIEANTLNALRDSGRFYLTAAGGPGPTPGGIGVGYLDSIVYASTYAVQWFSQSDSGLCYRRILAAGVWGSWVPLIDAANSTFDPALGTGGIVFSGSNANGSYIKFADGTMICTGVGVVQTTSSAIGTSGLFFSPTNPYATFPAAFVGTVPRVTYSAIEQTAAFSWVSNDAGASLTQVTSRLISTSVSATAKVTYVAIGRWK